MRSSTTAQRSLDRENEADEITREVLTAVRRTFITPFDRTDIQDLIGSMDDAIDQMNKTAKTITLFEVTASSRRCSRWARMHPAGGEARASRRCRCCATIGKNAGRAAVAHRGDHPDRGAGRPAARSTGRKALFLASRESARERDGLHRRHGDLRPSREGRRPLRGCRRTRSTRSSSIISDGRRRWTLALSLPVLIGSDRRRAGRSISSTGCTTRPTRSRPSCRRGCCGRATRWPGRRSSTSSRSCSSACMWRRPSAPASSRPTSSMRA